MFTKVSDLIKDTSLLSSQHAIHINMLINEAWSGLYIKQKELKEHAKIKMLKQDVLYLNATDGIWAQEIQLQKMDIVKKINKYLSQKGSSSLIKDIVIQVGA